MTKIDFTKDEPKGKLKAYAFNMSDGSSGASLAIKEDNGKVLVIYYDGTQEIQRCFRDEVGEDLIRDFYAGDTVTITF